MLKSMTGYARVRFTTLQGEWELELHSVNRKNLEIQISLPDTFLRWDLEIRQWLTGRMQRGHVMVRLLLQEEARFTPPYVRHLQEIKKKWEGVAEQLGFNPQEAIDWPFLLQQTAVVPAALEEEEVSKQALQKALTEAFATFDKMRKKEGLFLQHALEGHLEKCKELIAEIEELSSSSISSYQQRLLTRLKELEEAFIEKEERLWREVILFTEKCDITEELVRLRSHAAQFQELLARENSGKTLDFLVLEMNRESNTIAAKAFSAEISHKIIEMKGELEKMREQLQNIE